MTSVSCNRPRCLRSTSSAPIAWSHCSPRSAMVDFQIVVAVPWLSGAVPNLHESHAALDQPPGNEQLPRLHAGPVHVADILRLAAHVERFGRLGLHAKSQLERADAGVQCGTVAAALADDGRSAAPANRAARAARATTRDRCGYARLTVRRPYAAYRCTCLRRYPAKSRPANSAFPESGIRTGTWRQTPASSGFRCPGRNRATSPGSAEFGERRRNS